MQTVTLGQMAEYLSEKGYEFCTEGSSNLAVNHFCSLNKAKDYAVTWAKKPSDGCFRNFRGNRQNIIVTSARQVLEIDHYGLIITDSPKKIFFSILDHFFKDPEIHSIGSSSVIKGRLGEGVSVGEQCYIGEDVIIGNGTRIGNNVSIYHKVSIGNGCMIHSGTVIGADGFGYFFEDDGSIGKVDHFGGVEIGSNVEIGANTCIDRGTLDDTVIGDGSKIDNLVHIAHNTWMGKNVCVVAGAVICGSAEIGDGAYIAPGGIVKNQLKVGTRSLIGLGAVVTKPVPDEYVVTGVPAKPVREVKKGDK